MTTQAALPLDVLAYVRSARSSWPAPVSLPWVVDPEVLESRRSRRSWSGPLAPVSVAAALEAARLLDAALWPGEEPLGATVVTPDEGMLMQVDLAAAPALVLWHGDVEAAIAAHGGAGYRLLLTRGGAAAATFLLHIQQHGGVGCLTDGLLPPLRDDVPPAGRLALIGAAFGVPAEEED
ncbi:hypothetical protein [Hamadaea tsunoensis]|uniref:hypothetical protein n=1 Tax=Hamadaea tsunoensis TaxID=53368 RepID=UPI00048111F5|nr:hypothetical protein [Hamadaea tsunoensis]